MDREIIVEVGAEGGNLTLYGQRNGRGWLFSTNLVDQTMEWVDECPVVDRTSKIVKTWSAALKMLDQYPWHQLFPLRVHPDFGTKVVTAVIARTENDRRDQCADRWRQVCALNAQ